MSPNPTTRNAADYIIENFPIVKRKAEAQYGEYRTKLRILDIYDRIQHAIDTGEPYQTLLDPPPGPPSDEHGKLLPPPNGDPATPSPPTGPNISIHQGMLQKGVPMINQDSRSRELMYFPWLTIPSAAWLRHATLYWDGIRLLGDQGLLNTLAKIRPEMRILSSEGLLNIVSIDAFAKLERDGNSEQRSQERSEILSSPRGQAFLNSPAAEDVRQRMGTEIEFQMIARRLADAKEVSLEMFEGMASDPRMLEIGERVQQRAAKQFGVSVEQARRILIARVVIWSALCVRDFCGMAGSQLEPGTDYLLPGELLYTPLPGTHSNAAMGLSLSNVLPQPVPDAPIEKVLKLKSKHRLEYARFRAALHEMNAELSRASSEREFRHVLASFGDEFAAKRIELEKAMGRGGVGTVLSMVKAVINSAPSELMMSLGVEIWGQALPLGAKAAAYAAPPVIAVLKQGYASWKERRETVEGSEVGYLFHAQKMGLIGE